MIVRKAGRDVLRHPLESLLIVVSLVLSIGLAGVGAAFGAQVLVSNAALAEAADVPQLVQMHAGELEAGAIAAFAADAPGVTRSAVVELVSLDSTALELVPGTTESASVIEYSAMVASPDADRLIGLDGEVPRLEPGEVAIPVDIALDRDIAVGARIGVGGDAYTVGALIRDAMMGSDLASSRRILVAEADLPTLRASGTGSEWLIEFWLDDGASAPGVYDDYLAAGLPANGPMVDAATFTLLNGLSGGLVTGGMLVVAGLVALIATLLLSITIRTTIANDLPRLGTLRALGMRGPRMWALILGRHILLIIGGAVLGAVAALIAAPLVTESIRIRFGGEFGLVPVLAIVAFALLGALGGLLLARRSLEPALRGSPLPAMQGTIGLRRPRSARVRRSDRPHPTWWTLGRTGVRRAPVDHLTVFAIAFVAMLLAAVPLGLRATVASTQFAAETGIAVSDVLVGLRADATLETRLDTLETTLAADPRVERTATLRAERIPALDADGGWTGMNVESGDHTAFPLTYSSGRPPSAPDEIALSELNADSFGHGVGERLRLRTADGELSLEVVGIYRDVTNSGRTAKAQLPIGIGTPLWTTVLVDVRDDAEVPALVDELASIAAPARVTDVDAAKESVLGSIERSITALAWGATVTSLALLALLSALVLRLFLARDARQRAVAQVIGAPLGASRAVYLVRLGVPAAIGVIVGAELAPLVGSGLLLLAGRMMGASGLPLLADPLITRLLVPAAALAIIVLVVVLGVRRLDPSSAARLVAGQDL